MRKYLTAAGVVIAGASLFLAPFHACGADEHDGHDHKDHAEKKIEHNEHDGHDHAHADDKGKAAKPASVPNAKEEEPPVHLTDAQRKLIKIQVSKAVAGSIENSLNLNGEIQLNLEKTAKIMPRMPGFVNKIFVKEGDKVKKGQLLATLTSHKLGEYYSNYNLALEQEKLTKSEFEMAEKLKSGMATSQKEYLRYRREYAEAVISRRRAGELLKSLLLDPAHSDHTHETLRENVLPICTTYEISSPIDGTVIAKNITPGENFTEDNTNVVFTVSNLEKLWLNLRASPRELRQLKKGLSVVVSDADSKTEYHGKIVYIGPLVNEQTRTGLVRVEMDNSGGGLRPGEFVSGRIQIDSAGHTVVVPREAVQLIAGETVVFVPQGDGFAPKPVTPGKAAGGAVQIISGLKAGESFVSGGAFELKSILLTSGMDPHAGHGH